jgi:hypothetical protein
MYRARSIHKVREWARTVPATTPYAQTYGVMYSVLYDVYRCAGSSLVHIILRSISSTVLYCTVWSRMIISSKRGKLFVNSVSRWGSCDMDLNDEAWAEPRKWTLIRLHRFLSTQIHFMQSYAGRIWCRHNFLSFGSWPVFRRPCNTCYHMQDTYAGESLGPTGQSLKMWHSREGPHGPRDTRCEYVVGGWSVLGWSRRASQREELCMSFHHLIAIHSSLPFFRSHGGHLLYAKSTDMKLTQMRRQANCLGLEFGKDRSFAPTDWPAKRSGLRTIGERAVYVTSPVSLSRHVSS